MIINYHNYMFTLNEYFQKNIQRLNLEMKINKKKRKNGKKRKKYKKE